MDNEKPKTPDSRKSPSGEEQRIAELDARVAELNKNLRPKVEYQWEKDESKIYFLIEKAFQSLYLYGGMAAVERFCGEVGIEPADFGWA